VSGVLFGWCVEHFGRYSLSCTPSSDMTHSRLWVATFALCAAVMGLLWCWSLATPRADGDLTRVGRLSDREFGGPRRPAARGGGATGRHPLAAADVLVVGDSFSGDAVLAGEPRGRRLAGGHLAQPRDRRPVRRVARLDPGPGVSAATPS
jgi:hypothetical protein